MKYIHELMVAFDSVSDIIILKIMLMVAYILMSIIQWHAIGDGRVEWKGTTTHLLIALTIILFPFWE